MRRNLTIVLILFSGFVLSAMPAGADTLYVTNFGNNTVSTVDSSGNVATPITGVGGPIGDAFGPDGNLYVVGGAAGSPAVFQYTPSGTLLSSFNGGHLTNPTGIAFDSAGNAYVANVSNVAGVPDSIEEYQRSGSTYTFKVQFTTTDLNAPFGLAFDKAGNLYVANAGTSHASGTPGFTDTITRYSSTGTFLGTFGADYAQNNTSGNAPTGLAFDALGNLYVSNFGPDTINKLNAAGTTVQTLGVTPGGGPAGLAFDSSGNLYAALEFSTNSIMKFASTGPGSVSSTGTVFAQNNGLSDPFFIAVQSVPEPASLIQVAVGSIGMLGFGALRRRKRMNGAA